MSGGSYDYLCYKDSKDILSSEEMLEDMKERLKDFDCEDASNETKELINIIKEYHSKAQEKIDKLSGVWRAVEWIDSADSGIDYLESEIKLYRETNAN